MNAGSSSRRVRMASGSHREAARLGDRDEIAKMA
jgi:hypothetical protein